MGMGMNVAAQKRVLRRTPLFIWAATARTPLHAHLRGSHFPRGVTFFLGKTSIIIFDEGIVWTFKQHFEVKRRNGSGIRDPKFETQRIEILRTGRASIFSRSAPDAWRQVGIKPS